MIILIISILFSISLLIMFLRSRRGFGQSAKALSKYGGPEVGWLITVKARKMNFFRSLFIGSLINLAFVLLCMPSGPTVAFWLQANTLLYALLFFGLIVRNPFESPFAYFDGFWDLRKF